MSRRRYLSCILVLGIVAIPSFGYLPDRPAPPKYDAIPMVKLDQLEKKGCARFGAWTFWRFDEEIDAVLLVHRPSGTHIYMPWSSNGWLNYREACSGWYVLYSQGQPSPQLRDDLKVDKYLLQHPQRLLERGECRFGKWIVTVADDTIEFVNTVPHKDRMTIRSQSATFVHNGRTIGSDP